MAGLSMGALRDGWDQALQDFSELRNDYLIYDQGDTP
jgi:hypothetical protein